MTEIRVAKNCITATSYKYLRQTFLGEELGGHTPSYTATTLKNELASIIYPTAEYLSLKDAPSCLHPPNHTCDMNKHGFEASVVDL